MIRRNMVVLTGRATKKPDLKNVGSGSQVCTIRMVSNKRIKNKKTNEYDEKPMFIDAECWGPRAVYASENIDKGTIVSVVGELEQDEWGEGENRRQKHKIYVSFDLQIDKFGDKKNDGGNATSSSQSKETAATGSGGSGLPF
jgi:single-strand DNA-binding protein